MAFTLTCFSSNISLLELLTEVKKLQHRICKWLRFSNMFIITLPLVQIKVSMRAGRRSLLLLHDSNHFAHRFRELRIVL